MCIFTNFFYSRSIFLWHNGHGHPKWGASIFWTWISKKKWKWQKIVKIAEKCAYEWFPSYFSKSMGVFPMHPVKTATVRVTKMAPFFLKKKVRISIIEECKKWTAPFFSCLIQNTKKKLTFFACIYQMHFPYRNVCCPG